MAENKKDLMEWLSTLPDGTLIGIDDDGLALRAVGAAPGSAYYEIGGLPEESEDDE
jgi:hypothetical protein